MSRKARKTSSTGVYHVMIRGINKEPIFMDGQDGKKFLEFLQENKEKNKFELYAFCLMVNHGHFLIKEKETSISVIMKELCGKYGNWFNVMHKRTGHVFQDRFRSECVETNLYLKTVFRYILRNPVKANMVSKPEHYRWSSCKEFINGSMGITDTDEFLSLIDKSAYRIDWKLMNELRNEDSFQDLVYLTMDNEAKSDEEARCILDYLLQKWRISDFSTLNTMERELFVGHLKARGIRKRQYKDLFKNKQKRGR